MKIQKKLAIAYFRTKLNLLTLIHKRSGGKAAFQIFCTPIVKYKGKPGLTFIAGKPASFLLNKQWIRGAECNPVGHKTVLILHGFSSSYHKFDHIAASFIEKNYKVLAFDAPAHGSSDGKMVNALDYRNMIIEIIRLYGPINFFVAHSFGGLALCLALEKEKISSNVKLVLIAPATETTTAMDDALRFLNITNINVKEALSNHIEKYSGYPPEWFSVRRAIQNIKAKVLWIHDYEDFVTPIEDVLKVQADKPENVEFYFTRGLGHQKIYRDSIVKQKIIEFLQ